MFLCLIIKSFLCSKRKVIRLKKVYPYILARKAKKDIKDRRKLLYGESGTFYFSSGWLYRENEILRRIDLYDRLAKNSKERKTN